MSKTSNNQKIAVLKIWLEGLKKKPKKVVIKKTYNIEEEE
jgi:hypothetical protein